jgi:hypothetical protein
MPGEPLSDGLLVARPQLVFVDNVQLLFHLQINVLRVARRYAQTGTFSQFYSVLQKNPQKAGPDNW